MTWILTNDGVPQVLIVDDCLEVLEETFKDYALGKAAKPAAFAQLRADE